MEALLPPIAEHQLREFENGASIQLPTDYRDFLLRQNGASFNNHAVFVPGIDQDVLVDLLYGVGPLKNPFGLQTWLDEFAGEIPPGCLVIGRDPGGGVFLMSTVDEPGIYYWDHAHFFPQSSPENNTYPLSATFSQWLASLRAWSHDHQAV